MSNGRTSPYSFIPDAAYELIVYIFSGVLFSIIAVILFADCKYLYSKYLEVETFEKIVMFILLGICLYVYGQMASVFATYIVKKPSRYIVKHLRKRRLDDFDFNYQNLLTNFHTLINFPNKTKGNYWSLLYYMNINHPEIYDDLMVRYARVKLARLNSFNAVILSFIYIVGAIFHSIHPIQISAISLNPFIMKLSICLVFLLFSFVEYIQRQCWFGDIMVKAIAGMSE